MGIGISSVQDSAKCLGPICRLWRKMRGFWINTAKKGGKRVRQGLHEKSRKGQPRNGQRKCFWRWWPERSLVKSRWPIKHLWH